MRTNSALAFLGIAGLTLVGFNVPKPQHQVPVTHQAANVGEMFKKKCASCHVAPDLRFDVEKAWLGQVRETA
jgi:hypothetical protein